MEHSLGTPVSHSNRRLAEQSQRRTLSGASGTGVAIVASQAAVGLSFVVLARRLAPDDFGTYVVLYSLGGVLGGVLDFGSSQLRTRELAQGRGLGSLSSWLWRRAAWQFPAVLLAFALSQTLVTEKPSPVVAAALLSQGVTYPLSLGWTGAVRALRSPALGTWTVALGNALLLVAVAAAPDHQLQEVAAVAATGSWLATAAFARRLTRSRLGLTRTRWTTNPWAGAAGFGFFGLAVGLSGLQIVVVGAVAGPAEAGELGAVARWVQPVYLVAAAFSTQTFPSMAAATSYDAARRILRPVWAASALGAVAIGGIVVTAPWLVNALLGEEYANSVVLLQALAISGAPVLFGQPLATLLQARGLERGVAVATLGSVLMALAATAVAAIFVGALAAPVSLGLAQCFLVLIYVWLARGLAIRNA